MTPRQQLKAARIVIAYLTPANHPSHIDVRVYKSSIRELLASGGDVENKDLWSWDYDAPNRILNIHFAT